jgi:hypothetical protein
MTKKRYKVRFNLGRGENYMKWKIVDPDGVTSYYFPTGVQLRMTGCQLKNNKSAAQKIFRGESNKTVCAWVLCDKFEVKVNDFEQLDLGNPRLKYNPRVSPTWMLEPLNTVHPPYNVDNEYFNEISTIDYRLYITKI